MHNTSTSSDLLPAIETSAIHAGRSIDASSGAVMQPIVLSTTFLREADGSYASGFFYSRHNTPNRQALEECIAQLEQTNAPAPVQGVAFASGLAAAMAVFHALSPGDHVVAPREMYFGVRAILRDLYERWGLHTTFVDMRDLDAVRDAITSNPQTRLVWTETPANPTVSLTDLSAVAALAHDAGALCICDNTWAPLIQQPLALGCDVVMYSTTKYFGGHSDILSGMIVSACQTQEQRALIERIRQMQHLGGAVPSPFDCWLLLRSISTLPYRLKAHSANAQAVAEFLAAHPAVECVHYPGLATHPQHALALKQMNGLGERCFGGMVSLQICGTAADALAITGRMRLFTPATSLGGVESLIEHRASIEGPDSPTPSNLLRLSVGLEHVHDLLNDLQQALDPLSPVG
jgi:cystathionine gamma-synthase